jgi:NAD(P)-dependent dehydrogenase (short-subunit alcohol dehydrogenase family)
VAVIINVASILGLRVAGHIAAFAAAKAGVVQLTKALALEWARHNIRVNTLCPGCIEADLNRAFLSTEAGQTLIRRVPQRRLEQFADLDGPLLLLASDAGRFMWLRRGRLSMVFSLLAASCRCCTENPLIPAVQIFGATSKPRPRHPRHDPPLARCAVMSNEKTGGIGVTAARQVCSPPRKNPRPGNTAYGFRRFLEMRTTPTTADMTSRLIVLQDKVILPSDSWPLVALRLSQHHTFDLFQSFGVEAKPAISKRKKYMSVAGKVVIVTGGGDGIGKATATAFAESGAEAVVIVDSNRETGTVTTRELAARGHQVVYISADVSRQEDVEGYVAQTMDRFGRIDCLFNNAGIEGAISATWDYDPQRFAEVMAVNVNGVFLGMRAALPHMLRARQGTIVNTASVGGLVAAPGMSGYIASKHAVLGLTKCAASEAGPWGVRINAICPGTVETQMIRRIDALRWRDENDPMQNYFAKMTATRRNSTPQEIAELVLFLSSTRSGNISGTHIVSDGGRGAALFPWRDGPGEQ